MVAQDMSAATAAFHIFSEPGGLANFTTPPDLNDRGTWNR